MLTFSEYVSRHEDPEAEYEYLEKMILKLDRIGKYMPKNHFIEKEKYEETNFFNPARLSSIQ